MFKRQKWGNIPVCYKLDCLCESLENIRVSKCGLETRKSPSPSPTFGDKVGTGKGFSDSLEKIWGLHEGAFYQLFVRLSSATSFEPIFGNIDVPLGIY